GDVTVPDLLLGQEIDTQAAVVVLNTTPTTLEGLTLSATVGEGRTVQTPLPPLPPLAIRKVGFPLRGPAPAQPEPVEIGLRLEKTDGDTRKEIDAAKLPLQVRRPEQTQQRTFVSTIDRSVQYFAHVPATPGKDMGRPGLVLSLHGARVEARGQAAYYAPKPGLHVVAPTNRRPFGFDWEDWGRLDALEVLDLASKELNTDPRRTFL